MKRLGWLIVVANLAALAVLAFVYPHLMIAPGPLIDGHRELETDCFACHAPFRTARAERCIACHAAERIGLFTVAGAPVAGGGKKASFHQQLVERDCVACHADHRGVLKFRTGQRFSHDLLRPAVRDACEKCHRAPTDRLHRNIGAQGCVKCHRHEAWKPATFEHERHFALDRDHDVQCATCHAGNDFDRYTCYGCHEHTPAKIRAEHIEEGIRDFEDCVECHRSADEDDIRGRGRDGRDGRDDDD